MGSMIRWRLISFQHELHDYLYSHFPMITVIQMYIGKKYVRSLSNITALPGSSQNKQF